MNPGGSTHAFKVYYDTLSAEKKQVRTRMLISYFEIWT